MRVRVLAISRECLYLFSTNKRICLAMSTNDRLSINGFSFYRKFRLCLAASREPNYIVNKFHTEVI